MSSTFIIFMAMHVVKEIRFDAGSTENSLSSATFLSSNRIDVDPAAVKSQFKNPVEREVQTINKVVAALLIDQSTLGPSFWCYAVESSSVRASDKFESFFIILNSCNI